MKILYIECSMGVAGDMLMGALYELLNDEDRKKFTDKMNSLGIELKKLEDIGKNPIVVTSPIVRMYFKKLAMDYYKDIIVISYNEVESNIELQSVGMVTA